jgi:hypothetical protein
LVYLKVARGKNVYIFVIPIYIMADIRDVIKKVLEESNPKQLKGAMMREDNGKKFKPVSSFKLTFDSQQAQLEPIYYWLLDFIQDGGWKDVEKVTDNFMSSPGSGHFSELGQRATRMQEEGMKILGGLNQVVKSAVQIIYDLKEFELRLLHYKDMRSDDPKEKEAGMLALKQIWLDSVDLKRGRGAIHQMATMEMGYTTLREAFMMANSVDDLKKMNSDKEGGLINDQVMRVLIPRISEFNKWVEYSEKELSKRFKIEKSYLKSQVETIKLYSQWMKPYLKAAEELRQKGFEKDAALVNAFSTSMFELSIMALKDAKPNKSLGKYNLKREYSSCIVVGLKYRGHVSQRVTQKGDYGFAMGGRVDMTFDAYALNSEELGAVKEEMLKDDVSESMSFSGDVAAEALEELKEDLDYFLKDDDEKKEEEKKEKKRKEDDINPFAAIFGGFFGKKKKKEEKKGEKAKVEIDDIKPDNYVEKSARVAAAANAASGLYLIYDIYKKAHGMASAPDEGFENSDLDADQWEKKKSVGEKVSFKQSFKRDFEKL